MKKMNHTEKVAQLLSDLKVLEPSITAVRYVCTSIFQVNKEISIVNSHE